MPDLNSTIGRYNEVYYTNDGCNATDLDTITRYHFIVLFIFFYIFYFFLKLFFDNTVPGQYTFALMLEQTHLDNPNQSSMTALDTQSTLDHLVLLARAMVLTHKLHSMFATDTQCMFNMRWIFLYN